MKSNFTAHFDKQQAEWTRREIETRIDAANVAQWIALHGPIEGRAQAAAEAQRHMDALKRLSMQARP